MFAIPFSSPIAQRPVSTSGLRFLGTPPEERFDRIIRLAAKYFQVSTVTLNVLDAQWQWTKSAIGLPCRFMPRDDTLCTHVFAADAPIIVSDLRADTRFQHTPLVADDPHLRFYAGIPLRDAEGLVVGTFCLADQQVRVLTDTERADLLDFAALAERELLTDQISTTLLAQQKTEAALRKSDLLYHTLIGSLVEGVLMYTCDGYLEAWNASAERILGLSAAQVNMQAPVDPRWYCIHEDGTPFELEEYQARHSRITYVPVLNKVLGIHKPDGTETWVTTNTYPLFLPGQEKPYGILNTFVDITVHKQLEQQLLAYQCQLEAHNAALATLAATDGLTGVANKRTFDSSLEQAISAAQNEMNSLSLIMVDIDMFKAYNDSFGHIAGDKALQQVGHVLHTAARSTDVVARYGGEEFAIVLPEIDHEQALHIAERWRVAIAEAAWPHRPVTASFGVATWQPSMQSGEQLTGAADIALYVAKRHGRNCVVSARNIGEKAPD